MAELDKAASVNAARQLQESEARRLYVRQACVEDSVLQARVEKRLRVYEQVPDFLATPAEGVYAKFAEGVGEGPGMQVGPFKLAARFGCYSYLHSDPQLLCKHFLSSFLSFSFKRSQRSHAWSVNSTSPLVPFTTVQD